MSASDEPLTQPEAARALDAFADTYLAAFERDPHSAEVPDAIDFLRKQGVSLPEGATVRVLHTVERQAAESPNKVMRPICPDGSDGCRPTKCRWINGSMHCVWVCRCP